MLTGAPGDQLYTVFGHSAIHVKDPARDLDIVFNYGTFDFDTPNFYLKFLRGKLDYMLSIEQYRAFEYGYTYYGQAVREQIFDLDSAQKQQLYDFLLENNLKENRYYKYDFFYDNCATRIRDLFQSELGPSIRFDYPAKWKQDPFTFRQLLDYYLVSHPWYDIGIDIILGLPADKKASPADYMFLPDFMEIAFDGAKVEAGSSWRNLVESKKQILEGRADKSAFPWFNPVVIGWAFFVVMTLITLIGWFKNSSVWVIDMILFAIAGLIGWLIVFLWFFTEHIATKDNLNILWAIPFHFPLIFFIRKSSLKRFFKIYFLISLVLSLILLSFWNLIPQQFHNALIPVILILGLRSLFVVNQKKQVL
jgi:hypothetical protein